MKTTKRIIQKIGIHNLINHKDGNQAKGRLCPYFGASTKNPVWVDFVSTGSPEEALIYSLQLILISAHTETFHGGQYYCHDCKGMHFNNGSFLSVQNEFKLIHKDKLRLKLEKLLK